VEKITRLDPETQLSEGEVPGFEIFPCCEVFEECDGKRFKSELCPRLDPDSATRGEELISNLCAKSDGQHKSFALPYVTHGRLLDFCGAATVVIDECKRSYDAMETYYSEHKQRFTSLYEKGEVLSGFFGQVLKPEDAIKGMGRAIAFHAVTSTNRFFNPEELFNFKAMPTPRYTGKRDMLITDVQNWLHSGYKIAILCGEGPLRDSIRDSFAEKYIAYGGDYDAQLAVTNESAVAGEILHDLKLAVIGTNDLVAKKNESPRVKKRNSFLGEPKIGEYVVHEVHGVGLCEGITPMTIGKATRDYVVILYAGGDKLYVPIENLDVLTRYVSGGTPKLNKMGGADFAKQKAKVRESVKKLAFDLKELYAERFKANAHRYSEDDSLLREFEKGFEHAETDDQLKAVADSINDLKSGKIMDRLLCGDVGYGKTEVALRVAFKVIAEGKQVAFMSPTTVLAKQHYDTVVKRMEEFGVNVGRLTRFDSASEIRTTLEKLRLGKLDMVVGTHRILSKDVIFSDLGLLILDEEQRFGVGDKEKIKNLKRQVNVLTLSATPIPRTLHMSMVGIRDMSLLETPPMSRLPVQTYVTEYSDALVVDAIMREAGRNGQTFVVYNRVERMPEFASRIARLVPDLKITVAHGQMPETLLEKAIDEFTSGQSDVLISSTIIENGIDIPRANTIIVVDADRMGLSQLYQLRGRVGRSDRSAYAFFTFQANKILSSEAMERLEAIGKYTELGSGFKIAMRDLEIRGAGNILGAEQHGHMEKVGYDMYCSILGEVLAEMDGKEIKPLREVRMSVDYSTFIPDGYITDREWKLKLYSKISRVASIAERDAVINELTDMYGPVPQSVRNLISVAFIKNLAGLVDASSVVMNKRESLVVFDKVKDISLEAHKIALEHGARMVSGEKPTFKFPSNNEILKFLLKCHKLQIKNV